MDTKQFKSATLRQYLGEELYLLLSDRQNWQAVKGLLQGLKLKREWEDIFVHSGCFQIEDELFFSPGKFPLGFRDPNEGEPEAVSITRRPESIWQAFQQVYQLERDPASLRALVSR